MVGWLGVVDVEEWELDRERRGEEERKRRRDGMFVCCVWISGIEEQAREGYVLWYQLEGIHSVPKFETKPTQKQVE